MQDWSFTFHFLIFAAFLFCACFPVLTLWIKQGSTCIVNAASERDMTVFAAGMIQVFLLSVFSFRYLFPFEVNQLPFYLDFTCRQN